MQGTGGQPKRIPQRCHREDAEDEGCHQRRTATVAATQVETAALQQMTQYHTYR